MNPSSSSGASSRTSPAPTGRSRMARIGSSQSGGRRSTSALSRSSRISFRDIHRVGSRGGSSDTGSLVGGSNKEQRWGTTIGGGQSSTGANSGDGKTSTTSARNSRSYHHRPGSSMGRNSFSVVGGKGIMGGTISKTNVGMNIQGRTYNKHGSFAMGGGGRFPEFYSNPSTPRDARGYKNQGGGGGSLPAVTNPSSNRVATGGSSSNNSGGGGGGTGGATAAATLLSQIQPADEDGIIFAVSQKQPGVPFVYRSQTARMVSPERLNLDRRSLTVCPVLEGEDQLRLLNFENNNIGRISNLKNLPNLIFLDLYNNQIKEVTGLDSLGTLRVLMLGKNYIRKIERLESLLKLDVLDLHSNRITKIQNLSHLRDLRVLNLAGNHIDVMENLEGLVSLTELNLRRNGIHTVLGLEQCAALHRVFLSDNKISSFGSLESLFRLKSLSELTLDGNDVASNRYYREYMVDRIATLKTLDMRRVTEEEKRVAAMVVKNDEKLERQRREHMEAERIHIINTIESSWGSRQKRSAKSDRKSPSHSRRSVGSPRGFYEVTDRRCLLLYGNALEMLTSDMRVFQEQFKIEEIQISFYDIALVLENANKLRRFSNATRYVLRHNDIRLFTQLDGFAQFNLQKLTISDNKIASTSLFRKYIIFKLPTLQEINGSQIMKKERVAAEQLFRPVNSLTDTHLREILPTTKRREGTTTTGNRHVFKEASSKSRKITRPYVDRVAHQVLTIDKKVGKLHAIWPSIVSRIVRSTLSELESCGVKAPSHSGSSSDNHGGGAVGDAVGSTELEGADS